MRIYLFIVTTIIFMNTTYSQCQGDVNLDNGIMPNFGTND